MKTLEGMTLEEIQSAVKVTVGGYPQLGYRPLGRIPAHRANIVAKKSPG